MALNDISELLEKRRAALLDYCVGQTSRKAYPFLRTAEDLFELLRMDPLDTYAVQSSWVAEGTSCTQQYIHAAYRKLEPGYTPHEFAPAHLAEWDLSNNYPDWAALQLISMYPENYINPFVRQRKTSLFKNLENNLNQTRLNADSVQAALRDYLQAFEQTCDLDVISSYMAGYKGDLSTPPTPTRADYYFVGRQRVQPFQYFWRKAQIELTQSCVAVNPAAWGEWQAVDIQTANRVLDMRPVFWNGRLCLVWAEWGDEVKLTAPQTSLPYTLDIKLAFMTQNGQWSAPLLLHHSEYKTDLSVGCRLIATLWIDGKNPKGHLGVLLTNGQDGTNALNVYEIRDVLMRPVESPPGGWLEFAAKVRFDTTEVVQHPLGVQVKVVTSITAEGSMAPYMDLHVIALRVAGKDALSVQGFCLPTGLGSGLVEIELGIQIPAGGDPAPIKSELALAGGWATERLDFERNKGSWGTPTFYFKANGAKNSKTFTLTIVDLDDFVPARLLKNTVDAAQFLELTHTGPLKFVRLNSLFGPELVQRSHISVASVLDWSTQFLVEPSPTDIVFNEPNGPFDGANGLFFWELFFHLAHLVAKRLSEEERFAEAQNWLHYLFDPQAPADAVVPEFPNEHPKPEYWRCRPLTGKGNSGCEIHSPTDPDAIGYSAPLHFRILIFTEYVKNLMAWGDWYYRQLSRDSLVAAKLCYVQAEFLMGKAPSARTGNHWVTDTVGGILAKARTRPALEQFERDLDFSLADVGPGSDTAPITGMLARGPFRLPINQSLVDLIELPKRRISNLRENLTIDGSPRDIPLFGAPTDPNQLLADLASGGGGGPRPMGGRLVVNAFRWPVTFEAAQRAALLLQEYGNQVLSLLERRDRAEQEEMQQNHLVELGTYAQSVQEESIAQVEATLTALQQSRAVVQERADAYARRYDENVSEVEYQVMASLHQSKIFAITSQGIKPVGAAIAALPNIFGTSTGGSRMDKLTDAVCFGLDVASSLMQIDADRQSTTEGYRRRRDEWALQRDQALAEIRALDAQITAQGHAITAARTALAQTLRANGQALAVYNYLKKRASNTELFNWLLGQLKALHYQAYDAVVSLCLSAQSSMNAETGDYTASNPVPRVWLDQRHGLTAGDQLRAHLLRMHQEYLQRYERRLELVKTVSLRRLFDDQVERQSGIVGWANALNQLLKTGSLEFQLTQLLFDRDHPGHYCRQISAVEIDLPVLTGPYEDVRASLLQVSSMTATKATAESVKYLHDLKGVAPSDVLFNLRSGQRIVLSMGLADNGMTAMKPDEGLLNPFECSGAISKWMISFPWYGNPQQNAVLRSLTDIIVRIRYTAKAGELTFTRKVEEMVNAAEKARRDNLAKGVGSHE